MRDWVQRFLGDFPDDDPADHEPLSTDDRLSLEYWFERQEADEEPGIADLIPPGTVEIVRSIRFDPMMPVNGAADDHDRDVAGLHAFLAVRLGLRERGRGSRLWNRAQRAVARRERRRKRREEAKRKRR